jgi:hypothetical protein
LHRMVITNWANLLLLIDIKQGQAWVSNQLLLSLVALCLNRNSKSHRNLSKNLKK